MRDICCRVCPLLKGLKTKIPVDTHQKSLSDTGWNLTFSFLHSYGPFWKLYVKFQLPFLDSEWKDSMYCFFYTKGKICSSCEEMEFIILSLTKLIIVYFLKNLKILMAIMTLFDRLSLYCGEKKNLFLFLVFFFWKWFD